MRRRYGALNGGWRQQPSRLGAHHHPLWDAQAPKPSSHSSRNSRSDMSLLFHHAAASSLHPFIPAPHYPSASARVYSERARHVRPSYQGLHSTNLSHPLLPSARSTICQPSCCFSRSLHLGLCRSCVPSTRSAFRWPPRAVIIRFSAPLLSPCLPCLVIAHFERSRPECGAAHECCGLTLLYSTPALDPASSPVSAMLLPYKATLVLPSVPVPFLPAPRRRLYTVSRVRASGRLRTLFFNHPPARRRRTADRFHCLVPCVPHVKKCSEKNG
ncbi:hypothetical protein BD414DRAFT_566176 [Trametes punicea]|nr:hypothetical protein BD414DRAFT_566176 [Trametes punicea]